MNEELDVDAVLIAAATTGDRNRQLEAKIRFAAEWSLARYASEDSAQRPAKP